MTCFKLSDTQQHVNLCFKRQSAYFHLQHFLKESIFAYNII